MPTQALVAQLQRYLHENLNVTVALTPWADSSRLPLFLQERYHFFHAPLLGSAYLFMVDKAETEESPAAIRKHLEQVQAKWHEAAIYVRQRVTGYNRKRLIEQKVPFVVPGNQMYLPTLGIDLREYFRRLRPDKRNFSPSTQAVLIHALRQDTQRLSLTELAAKLGYSVMTTSRALSELETAELAESSSVGRGRRLLLRGPKPEVWNKAQEFLRTPVTSRHPAGMKQRQRLSGPQAGLSALAHYSMLAEPQGMVVALSRKDWRSLVPRNAAGEFPVEEPGGLIVEVWSYAPTLFARAGVVDPLSLYLSLRETQDERVEAALDRMMESLRW
ncbi:MAG: hypothetical protein NT049_12900 [Planctomycetota bacterium]|nr:hypothetical protein [Planctomycetota bacterium]